MLIDTHAHLEMLEGVLDVIQRARDSGVERILAVSSDLPSSKRSVEISKNFPDVFAAVGIHPHEASSLNDELFSEIESLAGEQKVLAIGETGLDYHYMHSPREVQIYSFRRHIELAKRVRLPLVIHVRDAHEDVLEVLREENTRDMGAVIHCFTGDYPTAKQYIDEGFYISFSGVLTFKNAEDIREAARKIPFKRILVETDSPYLAPIPFRGKRNEPAYVKYVAQKIAELRGVSLEEIEEQTTTNAKNLFSFDVQ
ncbi:MAG: TatD family hydrolase [Deltaproteobacteria bacterium]|nr:TatD family hydrolase [Deltaproteobacteria bacterium]